MAISAYILKIVENDQMVSFKAKIGVFSQLFRGVKMCDKMAISAYILKIVDPFLRLQIRAKEMFNCHQFFSTNKQYVKIRLMRNETNR